MAWARRAAGPSGELRVGYKVAARLGAWDIAPSGEWGKDEPEGRWSMVGECIDRDGFWMTWEDPAAFRLVLIDHSGRELRFDNLVRVFNDVTVGAWGVGGPKEQ